MALPDVWQTRLDRLRLKQGWGRPIRSLPVSPEEYREALAKVPAGLCVGTVRFRGLPVRVVSTFVLNVMLGKFSEKY